MSAPLPFITSGQITDAEIREGLEFNEPEEVWGMRMDQGFHHRQKTCAIHDSLVGGTRGNKIR